MSINFPDSPDTDDVFISNGISFQWDSIKWVALNRLYENVAVENNNVKVVASTSSVTLEPDNFNYYKISPTATSAITIPASKPFTSIIAELELPLTGSANAYAFDNITYDASRRGYFDGETAREHSGMIAFNPDGTRMFLECNIGDDPFQIRQYDLSTAYDPSTSTLAGTFDTGFTRPTQYITFIPSRSSIVIKSTLDTKEYNMSTLYDITTIGTEITTTVTNSASVSYFEFYNSGLNSIQWTGSNWSGHVYTTPYDFSTRSNTGNSGNIGAHNSAQVYDNGTKAVVLLDDNNNDGRFIIKQYTMSTGYDISTLTLVNTTVVDDANLPSLNRRFGNLTISPDGLTLFLVTNATIGRVEVFDISQLLYGSDITWSSNVKWTNQTALSLASVTSGSALLEFTTYDGTDWIAYPLLTDLGDR